MSIKCYFKIIYKYILYSSPVKNKSIKSLCVCMWFVWGGILILGYFMYEERGILILGYFMHAFLNEFPVAVLSTRREILEPENILAVGPYLASGAYRFCW